MTPTHLFRKVNAFFKNKKKTELWFSTPNPLLGDISPKEMIALGRERKLEKWIDEQLKLNTKGD